jgi:hypothetical protein
MSREFEGMSRVYGENVGVKTINVGAGAGGANHVRVDLRECSDSECVVDLGA